MKIELFSIEKEIIFTSGEEEPTPPVVKVGHTNNASQSFGGWGTNSGLGGYQQ